MPIMTSCLNSAPKRWFLGCRTTPTLLKMILRPRAWAKTTRGPAMIPTKAAKKTVGWLYPSLRSITNQKETVSSNVLRRAASKHLDGDGYVLAVVGGGDGARLLRLGE